MDSFSIKISQVMNSYGNLFNQNRMGPSNGTFEVYVSRFFRDPFREVAPKSYNKCLEFLIQNRFDYREEYISDHDQMIMEESLNEEDFKSWLLKNTTKFTSFDLALYIDQARGYEFSYNMSDMSDQFFIRGIIELDDPVNPTKLNGVEMPTEFLLFDSTLGQINEYMDEEEMISVIHSIAKILKTNPVR